MNSEYIKTTSPVFWEGVVFGLTLSALVKEEKDLLISERRAAERFGMTSGEFRQTFVVCASPKIAAVVLSVPGRKKVFRKYLESEVEALVITNKNKFNNEVFERAKKTKQYFQH